MDLGLEIATDELKKHEELNNINLTNLSEQTAIKLRLFRNVLIKLFLEHFKCFKTFRNDSIQRLRMGPSVCKFDR